MSKIIPMYGDSVEIGDGQQLEVAKFMFKNGSITSIDAFNFKDPETNEPEPITRLAAVIHTLRGKGAEIDCTMEKTPKGKEYGRYFFTKEIVGIREDL